jgi:hypothetical protein
VANAELRPVEALWLGGTAAIAAVCWASLATAHLGVLSVGSVLVVATAMVAVLAVPAWLSTRRARAGRLVAAGRSGWVEVAAVAAAAGLLLLLYLPGFPYGVADKDPGGYVQHGFSIARTGDVRIHDEALARLPDMPLYTAFARFPGIWVHDAARAEVIPQFYHLYPATLGFLGRLSGQTAMMSLNALLAAVSVLGVYLAGRRLAGAAAGAVAAAVLGFDMIEVWQAKYPTTEISTQLFIVLAAVGLVVAIDTRWWPPAALAGAALGIAWLDRADSLLLVLIAAALLVAAAVVGRWGSLHTAFGLGLGAVVPHAVYQMLGPAAHYSSTGGITAGKAGVVAAGLAVSAVVGRLLWRGVLGRKLERAALTLVAGPSRRLMLKGMLPAGLGLLALLGWLRPQLFGLDYLDYNGKLVRSYDEQNLRRLAWFVTVPGLLAALAGFAVVALRRWQAKAWIMVGPALALLVLYLYQAHNSSRLMWWSRRYIPFGLPMLALLIGVACAAALAWQGRGRLLMRVTALAVAAIVVGTGLVQSLPLVRHREFGGSFAASARIAAAADGRQGVFVWGPRRTYYDAMPLFAAPVWLQRDQLSVILPPNGTHADLDRIKRAFPGQPVFLVTGSLGLPPSLRQAGLRKVDGFRVRMPFWQESDAERPSRNRGVTAKVEVWSTGS